VVEIFGDVALAAEAVLSSRGVPLNHTGTSLIRATTVTATASSFYSSPDWIAANAFNGQPGDAGNAWASAANPAWIQAQVPSPLVTHSYSITARASSMDQTPAAWNLLGSNNGTSWTTLDSRSGQVSWGSQETRSYSFVNVDAYSYFRLDVSAVNGSSLTALSELTIYVDSSDPEIIETTASASYGPTPPSNINDGLLSTEWISNNTPVAWVMAQLSFPAIVTGYTITPFTYSAARLPRTWTFEGSNDAINFTVLDTQADSTGWVISPQTPRTFRVSTGTAYNFYRLNITANNGGDSYISIAEWSFSYIPSVKVPAQVGLKFKASPVTAKTYAQQVLLNNPVAFFKLDEAAFPTVTATAQSSAYPASNGVDGYASTEWLSNGSFAWFQLQYSAAIAATSYSITPGQRYGPNMAPKAWTLSGSNDGTTFTLLDTRTNEISWVTTPLQVVRTYTFASTTAYLYYRLNITANNGYGSYANLAEFSVGTARQYRDSTSNAFVGRPLGVLTNGQSNFPTLPGTSVLFGGGKILTNAVPGITSSFSIEGMINTTAGGLITCAREVGPEMSFCLFIGPVFGGAAGAVNFGFNSDNQTSAVWSAGGLANDSNWHHVVGVWAGTSGVPMAPGQMSIYIDGLPVSIVGSSQVNGLTPPINFASAYSIGANNAYGGAFAGRMADVAIYATALTASDVDYHYREALTRFGDLKPGVTVGLSMAAVLTPRAIWSPPVMAGLVIKALNRPQTVQSGATVGLTFDAKVIQQPRLGLDTAIGLIFDAYRTLTLPAGLQVVAAASVDTTPGWLAVTVSNGEPLAVVSFTVDATVVASATLDDQGQLLAMSVPLPSLAAGSHTVTVSSPTLSGSATFAVANSPVAYPSTAAAGTAPAAVAQTGVVRWVLQDPTSGGAQYIFPTNPSKMSAPHAARVFVTEHTTAPDGQPLTFEGSPVGVDWTIEGVCRTQEFHDALEAFLALPRRVYLIDHLSRAWTVTIETIAWTRLAEAYNDWAFTYQLKAIIYSEAVQL